MGNCSCNANNLSKEEQNENQLEISNDIGVLKDNQLPQQNKFPQQKKSLQKQLLQKPQIKCLQKPQKNRLKSFIQSQKFQDKDKIIQLPNIQLTDDDIEQIRKSLKKHFIFCQLQFDEMNLFIKKMKLCKVESNTFIFKQGDKSDSYYIILEGTCQVIINDERIKILSFGDSFGQLAILYNAPRFASVYMVQSCLLVQVNRQIFLSTMEQLSNKNQEEIKQLLNVLSFFQHLTNDQKNIIASTCLLINYKAGQIIFHKGDDANAFYVIKQGQVCIKQKMIQLKALECFGQNSIMVENGGLRSNTLVAFTNCQLISMSRENILQTFGDNIKNIIQKNLIIKIIQKSQIYSKFTQQKWKQSFNNISVQYYPPGTIIFKKKFVQRKFIYVLIGTNTLKTSSTIYEVNSIILENQILNKKKIIINEDVIAQKQIYLGKVFIPAKIVKMQMIESDNKVNQDLIMTLNDFYVVREISNGSFGCVYACYHKQKNKLYAIKAINATTMMKYKYKQLILNQQNILKNTPQHMFLIKYYQTIQHQQQVYFVMDLIQGQDLYQAINNGRCKLQHQIQFIVAQILIIIEHLHLNKVIYRDLKPQNLLLAVDGYLVLINLGTAKKLRIEKKFKTNTIIGTPHYMPPEVISGKGYSFQTDLWSLGVITYELIFGKFPFGQNSQNPFTIYEQIIQNSVRYPRHCAKEGKIFIEKLLSKNPQHRMGKGFKQLQRFSFFSGIQWKKLINKQIKSTIKPIKRLKITQKQIQVVLKDENNRAKNKLCNRDTIHQSKKGKQTHK